MEVRVGPLGSINDWTEFVRLPYRLHGDEPAWIPPLASSLEAYLSAASNPYFQHAEFEYFLAKRGERVVGRALAHIDHNLRRFHHNQWGLFGFFEAENDPEVSRALLEACEDWLAARESDRMIGPMELSTNHNIGLRIEGFDRRPAFREPWHPPYYRGLLERHGMTKAIDTVWREAALDEFEEPVREEIVRLATMAAEEHRVTVRPVRASDVYADLMHCVEILNAANRSNWGFVPLTEREVLLVARGTAAILDQRWALLAERDGEILGTALAVPDYNHCLAHMNGRDSRVARLKFRYYKRKIDQLRGLFIGVRPEYQHLGIAAAFVAEYLRAARHYGMRRIQMGWSFEGNEPVNRAMEGFGLQATRRYRVYEKRLSPTS